MNEKKITLDQSFKIGVDFHTKGKIIDAKNIYEKILKIKPDHFLALSNLGIVFSQLRDFNKAVELFNKAVKINPEYAEGFNNLGNALFELSEFDKSLDCYKKAIKLNPNFSDAFNNLGNVYKKKENLNKALESYEFAISFDIEKSKDKPYYNLGNIYRELGDYDKSINLYKKAISINPNSISALINLSISLNKNGNLKEAMNFCERAAEKDPKNVRALNNLGEYNQEIGNEDSSIIYYKKALELEPENLRSKWLLMNTFPIIYKNFEHIDYFKKHFAKNLKSFEDLISKNKIFEKKQVLSALSSSTNFYLHYHGDDITSLQKRYGALLHKLTKYVYPQFHKKIAFNKPSKFGKVGFISSFFCEHVISKLFKNWIIKLNKNKFRTFVYHIGKENDYITNLIKENCYSFFHKTNIDLVINKIVSDQLDVLIFLDIGMDPRMQILGSLKLAPIQCCAYGVPVTTGFENIDYFFSGESMETDTSQKHYSEKLIKLPALGVDYDNPIKKDINDLNYKKEKDKTIFLSLQSNFKLLPQHDHIYFEIIKKTPKCQFWFIGTKNEFIASKFKKRISIMCKENGLLLNDFFVFYPQTSYQSYLNLISKSDIILDSLDWSGLNTSLEAISLDKPIITLPTNFMRGRHTYGILKILKLDELICSSKKEYVDLAVKLSKNPSFLDNAMKKIKINKKLVFGNYRVIEYLEDFLKSLSKSN
jgi:predicted O-linked N-acetylglucosamine transferase (SPINDLY family)